MKKLSALWLLVLSLSWLAPAAMKKSEEFHRGIIYYLLGDMEQARRHIVTFFNFNPQPTLQAGFSMLLGSGKWDAAKKFKDYLETNYRSLEGLVGISLALADINDSMSLENYYKALRINPSYAPAFTCLGVELLKRKNYPAAEENLQKALRIGNIPEAKTFLAQFYLEHHDAQQAYDLIRPEADAVPNNYYFNSLTARACFDLNRFDEIERYLDQAHTSKPFAQDVQLLKAKYYLKIDDLKKAKALLKKLKFEVYNPDYTITFAEVLLKLKDREAEKYLYEFFSQNKWDPRINKFLGIFHQQKKDGNIQNWINRALLSGNSREELISQFPGEYQFPEYPALPLFAAKKIQWLSDDLFIVGVQQQSGAKENLLVMSANPLKVIKTFTYEGSLQGFFPSLDGRRIIMATTAASNQRVYVYAFSAQGNDFSLRPAVGYALEFASLSVGFSRDGGTAYLCDGNLPSIAFESPFSIPTAYGQTKPVYPLYRFPVYSYNFNANAFATVKELQSLRAAPIPELRQYFSAADAYALNSDVKKMVQKGIGLDVTASEFVKFYFSPPHPQFIIYFADLKNAFQANVYDADLNRAYRIDETMFLGENKYADLSIVSLNPEKNEIIFQTRDKEKALYLFNFKSLLYRKLASGVVDVYYNEAADVVLVLTEGNKALYFTDTNLLMIPLSPFAKKEIAAPRELDSIVDGSDIFQTYFSTYNGELLKMDDDNNFHTSNVSLEGALYAISPGEKRAALFCSGRLAVLNWPEP